MISFRSIIVLSIITALFPYYTGFPIEWKKFIVLLLGFTIAIFTYVLEKRVRAKNNLQGFSDTQERGV